jgi:tRNA(Ile)-lysidine synthase TilS/MesJ
MLRKEENFKNTYYKMPRYVYEFTNKRKLTKREFIQWFQKKFLYTIRRFEMAGKGDIIGYSLSARKDFRSVALLDLLEMFAQRAPIELVKLPSKRRITKRAIPFTSDTESDKLIKEVIKGKASRMKTLAPVLGKDIKPLYLFLDKEVELYCKLKGLKFTKPKIKKDKISNFIEGLEKKHPELKHSVIKTYLELFR